MSQSEPSVTRGSSIRGPVRLWHFLVLPAAAMGLVLLGFRLLEWSFPSMLRPDVAELYLSTRTIAIGLIMASLIAWLAVAYRRQYEVELRARNRDLERTRDFLAGVIGGSGEAIITLDENDRITSWNRAAESIYGWTASEMVGQGVERMLPDDAKEREDRARVNASLMGGTTVRDHEATRMRKDGSPIRVRITRSPLYDERGRFAGSTGIVRDVTQFTRMQERLLEQERLAAVGELAAQVAHEIRNPLAGIRGALELLFSGMPTDDPKQEIATEVAQQIDRLNRTVDDLLAFARPTTMQAMPTSLHLLIDQVLSVVGEDPQAKHVRVERRFLDRSPTVMVDPQQLEQVLFNVILNGCQVMNFDGTLFIRTFRAEDRIGIAIRDTGPGIPDKIRSEIFKPFFTTRSKGTGLGLAISRKILTAHEGTIEAVAPDGGGAEFVIHLPAFEGTAPE